MTGKGERAVDQPEGEGAEQCEHDHRDRHQAGQLVPGIQDGTRGLRLDHDLRAIPEREGLLRRPWGEEVGEPGGGLAPGLVDRRRRAVDQLALRVEEAQLVGADVP